MWRTYPVAHNHIRKCWYSKCIKTSPILDRVESRKLKFFGESAGIDASWFETPRRSAETVAGWHSTMIGSPRGRWKCRSGKCRSDKVWKAVRIEKSKIPEVYGKTKRTHEQRPDVHIQAVYGLTVWVVVQFTRKVRTNRVCSVYRRRNLPVNVWYVRILNFLSVCRTFMQFAPWCCVCNNWTSLKVDYYSAIIQLLRLFSSDMHIRLM